MGLCPGAPGGWQGPKRVEEMGRWRPNEELAQGVVRDRMAAVKETLLELVRAIPATFQLVYRVARDDRVDDRKRAVVLASLGYAILPFDLIPDKLPLIGKLDDLAGGKREPE